MPLAEGLRQGLALGLYKLMGDIGPQIEAAIEAQKKGTEKFESDEEEAWSADESDEDEPLIRTDLPMAYEIQIRGVRRAPPSIAAWTPELHFVVFCLVVRGTRVGHRPASSSGLGTLLHERRGSFHAARL